MYQVLLTLLPYAGALQCMAIPYTVDPMENVFSFYPTDVLNLADFTWIDRHLDLRPWIEYRSHQIQAVRHVAMDQASDGLVTAWVELIPADGLPKSPLSRADHETIFAAGGNTACILPIEVPMNISAPIPMGCLSPSYPEKYCHDGLPGDRFCSTTYNFYVAVHWCFMQTPGCVEHTWMETLFDPTAWQATWSAFVAVGAGTRGCRRYLEYNELEIKFDQQSQVAVTDTFSLIADFAVDSKDTVYYDLSIDASICITDTTFITYDDLDEYVRQYVADLTAYLDLTHAEIIVVLQEIVGNCGFEIDEPNAPLPDARRRLEEEYESEGEEGNAINIKTILVPFDPNRETDLRVRTIDMSDFYTTNTATSVITLTPKDESTDPPTKAPPEASSKSETPPIWIGIGIAIALLLWGLLGYWSMDKIYIDRRTLHRKLWEDHWDSHKDKRIIGVIPITRTIYKNVPFDLYQTEDPCDVTP